MSTYSLHSSQILETKRLVCCSTKNVQTEFDMPGNPISREASSSTVDSYDDSDGLFSPATSSEARTSTQCSPFPKEISLFPNCEEPDHSDSEEDDDEEEPESYWYHDPNASSVSLASVTSSVLSFYRLQTPPQSLLDGYVNDEHLMKRIELNYDARKFFPCAEPSLPQHSVETIDLEEQPSYALTKPLERYPNALLDPSKLPSPLHEFYEQAELYQDEEDEDPRETRDARRTKSERAPSRDRSSTKLFSAVGKAMARLVKKRSNSLDRNATL